MLRYVLLIATSLLCSVGYAQSVTPFVVSPAGDFFVNTAANASLSFTVGEMAMVETFSAPNNILTQGFQQPVVQIISVGEGVDYINEFVVYPNPATDHFEVRYRLAFPGVLSMRLVNLNGVEVMPAFDSKYSGGFRKEWFSLDQVSQGLYFLQVTYDVPSRNINHVSHYKINVIQ